MVNAMELMLSDPIVIAVCAIAIAIVMRSIPAESPAWYGTLAVVVALVVLALFSQ